MPSGGLVSILHGDGWWNGVEHDSLAFLLQQIHLYVIFHANSISHGIVWQIVDQPLLALTAIVLSGRD